MFLNSISIYQALLMGIVDYHFIIDELPKVMISTGNDYPIVREDFREVLREPGNKIISLRDNLRVMC